LYRAYALSRQALCELDHQCEIDRIRVRNRVAHAIRIDHMDGQDLQQLQLDELGEALQQKIQTQLPRQLKTKRKMKNRRAPDRRRYGLKKTMYFYLRGI
jgi:hypothetical protein